MTRQPWHFIRRQRAARFAELDGISRQRALTELESRELARLIRAGLDKQPSISRPAQKDARQ